MSRFIFWALVALVVVAPLPLAGNRPAPWSAMAIWVGMLLVLWALVAVRRRPQGARVADRFLLPVLVAFAGAIGWMLLQIAGPLPADWQPPAMARASTAYRDSVTSTFINRNSYATYAALGLLCALALMFSEWRRLRAAARHPMALAGARPLAGAPRNGGAPGSELRLGLLSIGAAVLAAALLLTGSRGGFYGLAATLAIVVALLALAGLLRGWRLFGVIGLGALAGAALLLATGGGLSGRLDRGAANIESSRGALFAPTVEAIRQRPMTGYGPGSFQGVFEAVNDGTLYRQGYYIDKAHNTYLELALEAGIPAALAMVAAIFAIAALCLVALLRRRAVRFALAGLGASIMVAIHALVDFSLQMPAVAVTYAAVLGVCAAQSLRRLTER